MDAVGQRPVAVGGSGWHRLGAVGRGHEAKRGRIAGGHVHDSILGRWIMVFGLGAHLGSRRHGVCGAERLGRGSSRPWEFLLRSTPFPPDAVKRTWMFAPVLTSVLSVGFGGSGDWEAPAMQAGAALGSEVASQTRRHFRRTLAAHWMRSGGFIGGDVQGAGRGHCVRGGSHHD